MNRPLALALLLPVAVIAADKAGTADPDLPQPLDAAVTQPLLENPPFTRALNLSDSLTLTGIAYIEGKTVATILDKVKKTTYLVSEQPNAQGWKLAEASAAVAINHSIAKIMVGNEVVTVRYSPEQTAPDESKKGSRWGGQGGGEDKGGGPPRGGFQRPSEEDRRRYESLSDQGKEKVRNFFRDNRDHLMNITPEERMNFIRQNFDRILKEDTAGK